MILFLTTYMKRGYGVSVVIENLSRELHALGVETIVGCLEKDDNFPDLEIFETVASPDELFNICNRMNPDVIVAHSTPFFERLPELKRIAPVWAWEHGDPHPDFFYSDRTEREKIETYKLQHVYPNVSGVIAISEFIRVEIAWPEAKVIYNGCDHTSAVERTGPDEGRQLKVGSLLRLGKGEALYKGNAVLIELAKLVRQRNIPCGLEVMGRGTEEDKAFLEAAGLKVHLNATDQERDRYLMGLDVFVSPSLWEGFNLPLVEAQSQGTVGVAFDVGAHPETTPIVCGSLDDMIALIEAYATNRRLVVEHSARCEKFVRRKFSWAAAALAALEILGFEDASNA
jgi:glycosyltransferase involved in cell wall biosynthesis